MECLFKLAKNKDKKNIEFVKENYNIRKNWKKKKKIQTLEVKKKNTGFIIRISENY